MSSSAETIKDRLGVVEVLGSYIKLEKSGSNYKARCPFHHEKTPSFFVSPDRNSYYCFGCQAKGDIFTFVQEFEKVDFVGALKLLAEKAGVELEQFRHENSNKSELDKLRNVLEISTKFYEGQLQKSPEVKAYLEARGFTEKTIKDWRIGFAPNEWRLAHDYLLTQKISEREMEAVGLIKHSDKEKELSVESGPLDRESKRSTYDRFRGRVMFPLFDPSSRVIGYSGRILGPDQENAPKYLNSPDTILFNKSDTLYGYNKAREGIRQWKYAVLVEGQVDLLMCHQNGFTNAVATSGTALTHSHLEKLKRLSDNIMLVYDADRAGLKATLRAWTSALALGMDVKVAALPQGEDPASLILKNKEDFKKALKNSKHIIEYYLDILSTEHSADSVKFKKSVEVEVLPYVASIDSAIERSNFISKVSVQTGISESDVRIEVDKLIKNQATDQEKKEAKKELKVEYKNNTSANSVTESVKNRGAEILTDITTRRIAALIAWFKFKGSIEQADNLLNKSLDILSENEKELFEECIKTLADELIFEAEVLYAGSTKLNEESQDLLFGLEERSLKKKLGKTMTELQIAEHKKDKSKVEELAKVCQEISVKLSALHKGKRE